ncbi:MAG: toxic anion resistance protein [Clostridia bacterium]|nr:toxic anion resistance protein [Clostridia bacterium]
MTKPAAPDLNDVNAVLNYGAEAQARVAEFSEVALENLKAKDLGEISGKITELIVRLKEPSGEEKPSILSVFRKPATAAEGLKLRYQKACDAVDRISLSLQGHRDLLMKDIELLELLYTMNREQYEDLTAHIEEGRAALERFRTETAIPLRERAEKNEDPRDAQAARDAMEKCERFEKKLHDLDLTRTVSLQMAPQIRILQNNNTVMAEKIQSSVVNTIPLWKSQMVLTLGMENSRTAIELQTKVSDITNLLLKKNAEALRETTLAVTRESERSCIAPETLRETNEILLDTLSEMLKIREEGQKARREAEGELRRLEQEIRRKLISSRA